SGVRGHPGRGRAAGAVRGRRPPARTARGRRRPRPHRARGRRLGQGQGPDLGAAPLRRPRRRLEALHLPLGGRVPAVELRVSRLNDGAVLPTRAHEGDAGLDLYACEAAHIGPGERWSVGTGIAIEVPTGHAGLVLPRSGLAREHGISLVNSPGLIDAGYRGEVRVLLLNTDPAETFRVEPGDRVAHLVIAP